MKGIVIFDGTCNFCSDSVNFILRHEAKPDLFFTPLQSPAGSRLLRELNFDPEDARTFVFVADGIAYVKSTAAIRLCAHLRGAWQMLAIIKIIPLPIRDWAYDIFARNRYRCFGRLEACMVPSPELAARFILE